MCISKRGNTTVKMAKEQETKRLVEIPDLEEAIKTASKGLGLKGNLTEFNSTEQDAILEQRVAFDGGNTVLNTGDVLVFEPTQVRVGIADIGTRGATVMLVPCGVVAAGQFTYRGLKQVYLSTFTKVIRVTDENGNPVIGPDGAVVVRNGVGNAIWEAMTALPNDLQRKNWLAGRALRVISQVRDFAPAGYVQIGNSNIPKAHRLTTLNLFEDITSTLQA